MKSSPSNKSTPKARLMYAVKPEWADAFVVADSPKSLNGKASVYLFSGPFATKQQAMRAKRVDDMTFEAKALKLSILIYRQFHGIAPHPEYERERGYIENARAILKLFGETEGDV